MSTSRHIALIAAAFSAFMLSAAPRRDPVYTKDGQLTFPDDYREWIFLSSGSGMTYGPLESQGSQDLPLFDNVFVNPESYRSFLETGHWPDKTTFVLEVRSSEGHASINNGGHFQRDVVGIEAEVKDTAAASGTWTFYAFPPDSRKPSGTAKAIPRTASCYACHGTNTAVENTFVQFYPVLYAVAERKGTLQPGFAKLPITSGELLELVTKKGWAAAEIALAETVRRTPGAAVLSERSLKTVGFSLMKSQPSDAVKLMQWAAARYPQSAAVQDTLADAYLAADDKEAARRATGKALELLDHDSSLSPDGKAQLVQSAKERLQRLK
jgi:hypothetical protein